jgi:enoyl-CoA hydratase/carnithine racemase
MHRRAESGTEAASPVVVHGYRCRRKHVVDGVGSDGVRETARMTEQPLTLERHDDGVAVITLTNGKVNALSIELLTRLREVVGELTADLPGAVVVTGGDRLFAAGADISQFGGQDEAATIGAAFHDALDALAALPRMVIAAVSGFALGGGCELALACDYRIASERAVFGQPEILLGIIPGGGGTQRLSRVVGTSRATEMCLTGRQVRADEALRIGLADEVVAPDALMPRARELAAELAGGALTAQAICKRVIDAGVSAPLADGLELERAAFVEVFGTDDAGIGVASFLEHGPGKATFTGH